MSGQDHRVVIVTRDSRGIGAGGGAHSGALVASTASSTTLASSSPSRMTLCARSEVDGEVVARLGAARQEVADRGRLEGFWCVGDFALQEAGLAGMAHASPARPTNWYVACLGKLKDAGEGVVPADV